MQAVFHLREALEQAGQHVSEPSSRSRSATPSPRSVGPLRRSPYSIADSGSRGGESQLEAQLQAALIAAARWEPSAQSLRHHAVTALRARAAAGEELDPLLHAQMAIETAGAGADRVAAIDHARRVLEAAPELTHGATTVPEAALVLSFAGLPEEAWRAIQGRLEIARRLGWPLGIASASTCASPIALHLGWISEAIASARGAMTPGAEMQLAPITLAFLIEALIERGDTAAAWDELRQQGHDGELPLIWPTTPLLLARGRLRAATGDHAAAVEDLVASGKRTAAWDLINPAMTPWRSSAAISLATIGERDEAIRLATEELSWPSDGERRGRPGSPCAPQASPTATKRDSNCSPTQCALWKTHTPRRARSRVGGSRRRTPPAWCSLTSARPPAQRARPGTSPRRDRAGRAGPRGADRRGCAASP